MTGAVDDETKLAADHEVHEGKKCMLRGNPKDA